MLLFFILVILVTVIILAVLSYKPGSNKIKSLKAAIDVYDNHLLNEAMKKFQALLDEEPYNGIYHWYVALCALQRMDYSMAIYHLESVLQINNYNQPLENMPDIDSFSEIGVQNKLMEIYETLKIKEKILGQYEKLMKLDTGNEIYPFKMAQYMIAEKNYSAKTQEYVEKTLQLNPKNAGAQFLLSLLYFKKGEFDNALQSAEKTLNLDKSINDAQFIMGYARYRINLKDEAERHFRDAALCQYFKKSTAFYMAKILQSGGKTEYALPYAAEASKLATSIHEDPSLELDAKYLYATMLEQSDQFDEAQAIYQDIERIQPNYQDVSKRLKYMTPVTAANKSTGIDLNVLEIFKKMRNDEFGRTSESVLENLGYKIKKIDLIDDRNINMMVHATNETPNQLTGVFIRRGIGIIQEDHIKKLEHFMSGMQVVRAILITPNDFNPAARKMAEKRGIKTINGEELIGLLKAVIK